MQPLSIHYENKPLQVQMDVVILIISFKCLGSFLKMSRVMQFNNFKDKKCPIWNYKNACYNCHFT